jgi:hypothetical protein
MARDRPNPSKGATITISQGHADRREKLDSNGNNNTNNGQLEAIGAATTAAAVLVTYSSATPSTTPPPAPAEGVYREAQPEDYDDNVYSSKDFLVVDDERPTKNDPATGQLSVEQPLLTTATVADRGVAVSPDVEYGEYRRPEVTDNELAVAVAIEEEDDQEKEFLVFSHAVEYDPDSKPPIYKNRRFRLYMAIGCCLFLIVLIVVIVVSVTSGGSGTVTTMYLTNAPTDSPTASPTNARESVYRRYFAEEVSSQASVPGTAAFLASEWIINDDPRQVEVDSDRLKQRYMLALLYFHTTGLGTTPWLSCNPPSETEDDSCTYLEYGRLPDDTVAYTEIPNRIRWLSSADECQWEGVLCGNGDTVVGIEVGKCFGAWMDYEKFQVDAPLSSRALTRRMVPPILALHSWTRVDRNATHGIAGPTLLAEIVPPLQPVHRYDPTGICRFPALACPGGARQPPVGGNSHLLFRAGFRLADHLECR